MTQAFSVQDLEYLTNLGPAALNDGPIAALEQAWRECLAGQVVRPEGCAKSSGIPGDAVSRRVSSPVTTTTALLRLMRWRRPWPTIAP